MSGSTIISPNTVDTNLLPDNAPPLSIVQSAFRQLNDSLAGIYTTQQSGNYTFVLADRGTMVEGTSASGQSFTVPPNSSAAFQIGTVIAFCQYGVGQITINAGVGVTLRTSSSLTTRAQYSEARIRKRNTNEWVVSGDLT